MHAVGSYCIGGRDVHRVFTLNNSAVSEFARRHADELAKRAREMTLVAKTDAHRDLSHEQLAPPYQSLRMLYAAALHVTHRRLPRAPAELSSKMETAEPSRFCQIVQ